MPLSVINGFCTVLKLDQNCLSQTIKIQIQNKKEIKSFITDDEEVDFQKKPD